MKAMIFSDFILTKRILAQLFVICAVITLFIAWASETLVTVTAAFSAMVPLLFIFSAASYDEVNEWQSFRLSMPLSRNNVVCGRYVALLFVAIVAAVIGLAFAFLVGALAQVLNPLVGELTGLMIENTPVEAIGYSAAGGAAVALVMAAFTFPFAFRFGMTKAVRFVPLAIAALSILVMTLFGENGPLAYLVPDAFQFFISDDNGFLILFISAVGIAFILYLISLALSCKLYQTREL